MRHESVEKVPRSAGEGIGALCEGRQSLALGITCLYDTTMPARIRRWQSV